MDIKDVKFDGGGLVPAIAQDASSGRVLMQAYMNAEALNKTLATGQAHYYSRSRKKLWRKGEESGHVQNVHEVLLDCDGDSILLKVSQTGPACHTNNLTCYYTSLKKFDAYADVEILRGIADTVKARKASPEEGSYTNYLLDKGTDKICKKVAEEAGEVIIAAKNSDNEELSNEMADLLYHILVLCEDQNLSFSDAVLKVLTDRHSTKRKREY